MANYCTTETCGGTTDLQREGAYQYMLNRPELFNPTYRWWQDAKYGVPTSVQSVMGKWDMPSWQGTTGSTINGLKMKISDLGQLKRSFSGPEATYIRWMIDDKIHNLQYQVQQEYQQRAARASQKLGAIESREEAAMETPGETTRSVISPPVIGPYEVAQVGFTEQTGESWTPNAEYAAKMGTQKEWLGKVAGGSKNLRQPKTTAVPIPDWMVPYLEPSAPVTTTGRRQQTTTPASTLRPMGAQAELTPDQLGQMAGYEAYTRAGAPSSYSEAALLKMAEWERRWAPYIELSRSLFPTKTKLNARWMPALQR